MHEGMNVDSKNNGLGRRGVVLCDSIVQRVERWTRGRLVVIAVAAGLVLTLLAVMGLVLEVGDGQGMERFLEAGAEDASIAGAWQANGVWWLALAYLVIDAVVFVPLYGVLLIGLSPKVMALNPHSLRPRVFMCAVVLFALAAMVADEVENLLGVWALLANGLTWPGWPLVVATKLKWIFFVGAVGLLLLGFLRWLLAFGDSSRQPGTAVDVLQRARLRFAAVDVIWRSRYVLGTLVFFAALVLVMNQSRDVLAGVAHGWQSGLYVGAAFAMGVSAVSIWALAYMCWMWTRILCRFRRPTWFSDAIPGQGGNNQAARTWPLEAHQFAKWWARLLGAAPVLMVAWLCGLAAQDAVRAQALSSAYLLLGFGAMTLLGAIVFLWGRSAVSENIQWDVAPDGYFEYKGDPDGMRDELHLKRYRFLGIVDAPIRLPIAALLLLLGLRLVNLWLPEQPPVTLAVICSAMTLWAGVVGLLAQYALRSGFPVLGALVIVVAGLGWWGVADNHMVWSDAKATIVPLSTLTMWGAQTAIAFTLMVGVLVAWCMKRGWRGWRRCLVGGLTLLAVVLLPAIVDWSHVDSGGAKAQSAASEGGIGKEVERSSVSAPDGGQEKARDPRPTLEQGLVTWLEHLCGEETRCQGAEPLNVYFVSAEGGGIRAAYWPALVLAELSARIAEFDERTFSLSGVSGGAVGISVYRACREHHPDDAGLDTLSSCIRRLGASDLLTPLLGSWMFEDVLARFIPTAWCDQPGCGFLSRGAWFERRLEEGLAEAGVNMRAPLVTFARAGSSRLPHLFLNSTWVETGERAIASDVRIESKDFPTARDQIDYLKPSLPLSTAAHNAARFPFVNAIGSVRVAAPDCPSSGKRDGVVICGHLADGGYFDNSGGHTTADILRALGRLLRADAVGGFCKTKSDWLRANLVVQVIMIRNGVDAAAAGRGDPAAEPCDPRDNTRPRCSGHLRLFADFLGPLVTAVNAVGTGANGRLAESLQARAVESLSPAVVGPNGRGQAMRGNSSPAVVNINLEKRNVMYPLGWYLSPVARRSMEEDAKRDEVYAGIRGL